MTIRALQIPNGPLAVFQILPLVPLLLLQITAFALHLVVGLGALSGGSLLPFPREFPVVLLNLKGMPRKTLLRFQHLSLRVPIYILGAGRGDQASSQTHRSDHHRQVIPHSSSTCAQMAAERELVLRQALENPRCLCILARLRAEYNSYESSGLAQYCRREVQPRGVHDWNSPTPVECRLTALEPDPAFSLTEVRCELDRRPSWAPERRRSTAGQID